MRLDFGDKKWYFRDLNDLVRTFCCQLFQSIKLESFQLESLLQLQFETLKINANPVNYFHHALEP